MRAQPASDLGVFFNQTEIKAVNVLIAAAGVAQRKGAFSLEDAKHVHEAITVFQQKIAAQQQDIETPVKGSLGQTGESD